MVESSQVQNQIIFIGQDFVIKSKSNLFAQQLTLYRQNHVHVLTYYIIISQIYGYTGNTGTLIQDYTNGIQDGYNIKEKWS